MTWADFADEKHMAKPWHGHREIVRIFTERGQVTNCTLSESWITALSYRVKYDEDTSAFIELA